MRTYLITVSRSEVRRVKVKVTAESENLTVSQLVEKAINKARDVAFLSEVSADEVWYEAEYIKEMS